jgi:small subunit ribosomal protein S4
MSRYRGPRIKIVRRLGLLAGLTNKTVKTKANLNNKLVTKKKVSQYRVRLEEKQKLRFYYGLTERQLLRYVRIARNTKGSTGSVLLQLLEMRLDNTLFRLGMTLTIPAARQLVNHGHILVNKRVVDIPSYCCKPQDMIAIRDRVASRDLIDRNLNSLQQSKIPSHLTLTTTNRTALVNQLVNRESIGVQINELLVVEYYSRQA